MRVAVHFHLFYLESLPLVKKHLSHLASFPHDLYITVVQDNPASLEAARKHFPHAVIWQVPNRGYDVGPFIYFLQHIRLENYDFVLKIHTKDNSPEPRVLCSLCLTNQKWMRTLLHALLGSPRIFAKNIKRFERDPKLGMIGSRYFVLNEAEHINYLLPRIRVEMKRLSAPMPKKKAFMAGTMFLMRSHLLQKFREVYSIDDFAPTDPGKHDRTLAHIMERVFGFYTLCAGYTIRGFDRSLTFEYQHKIQKIRRFITKITTRHSK